MRLIDADELLRRTILNPLHAPYITKNDIKAAPTVYGWVSVKDRLPEESCVVLAYHDYGVMQVLDYSKKHRLFNCHDWNNKHEAEEVVIRSVTYWQQLPEPPKEEE